MRNRYLFFILIVLTSCELVVEVDVPQEADRMVVNGIQRPDSLLHVEITRSRYILAQTGYYFPVPGAMVEVVDSDGCAHVLSAVYEGFYRGKVKPVPGHSYVLRVSAPGVESVESSMTMPDIVKIVDIKWDSTDAKPYVPNLFIVSNLRLDLTINDPPGENFYLPIIYSYSQRSYNTPNGVVTDTTVRTRPLINTDRVVSGEDEKSVSFSDETFPGKTYTAPLSVQLINSGNEKIYKLEVRLYTITKDYHLYDETEQLASTVEGNPFAQPVQVHSNIQNGFGIFAGASYDSRVYEY